MALLCESSALRSNDSSALYETHILNRYAALYGALIIAFLVYMSDIFTAVTMLTTKSWSNQIFDDCQKNSVKGCIAIPFETGRWLFVGCIIFSFLLVSSPHQLPVTHRLKRAHICSSGMKHTSAGKSSAVAISPTRSPMLWQTTTTRFVCLILLAALLCTRP